MPIDAGIYGQIQQPQQQNPLNALAQAMQIRGAQYQIDKASRDDARQNKLLSVLQSPEFQQGDAATRARLAYGAGDVDAASKITTTAAAANKDQRAADVSQLDMKIKQLDAAANIAGSVTDQASYERGLGLMQQLGFDTSKFSPAYNPDGVRQFAQATLSAKDRLTQQVQMRGQDITRQNSIDTNATSASNNANTVDATRRGQDLTASTAAAGQEVTKRGQDLTNQRAIDAQGNKPLTDSQAKSALFGARMEAAGKIIDDLSANGTNVSIPGQRIPVIGGAVSAMSGSDQQKLRQAKLDFMTAALRRESGAAISPSEFDTFDKQNFPQIGEDADVRAQKAEARQRYIKGVQVEVPNRNTIDQINTPAAKAGPIKVTNAADYANVPSGATYTTPDGKMRRKP